MQIKNYAFLAVLDVFAGLLGEDFFCVFAFVHEGVFLEAGDFLGVGFLVLFDAVLEVAFFFAPPFPLTNNGIISSYGMVAASVHLGSLMSFLFRLINGPRLPFMMTHSLPSWVKV